MIEVERLDHVQLCIPPGSEAAAREFYGSVLGLEEVEKPESLHGNGGLWFLAGDVELHLGIDDVEEPSTHHPAFEVVDIESVRERLTDEGLTLSHPTPIPGRERFTFRDPFDNRIEFLERE